jgi:hypothetical protein
MNFLQLAQTVRRESGISGDGPVNVAAQTGMYGKVINWVQQAHEEIQLAEHQWRFDWAKTTQTLTAGQAVYDPLDWNLQVRQWKRDTPYAYLTANGPNSRHWLAFLSYPEMVHLQTNDTTGLPVYFTETPDRKLELYPAPQAGVTLVMEYFRKPLVLVNNSDEPRMPSEYHMAIAWRAVMMCCAEIEDMARFGVAMKNYTEMMMRMRATELEPMSYPEALA